MLIAHVLIGGDQTYFVANRSADKPFQRHRGSVLDHLTDQITLAADRADHTYFAASNSASSEMFAFAGVLVFFLPADESFVNFDDAHELLEVWIVHRGAESMAKIPCGMKRRLFTKKHPSNLARRNAFLTLKDRVENLEPSKQGNFRVLENRSRRQRKTVGVSAPALGIGAFPFPRLRNVVNRLRLSASRTSRTVRPAPHNQELATSVFVRKLRHQFVEGHRAKEYSAK